MSRSASFSELFLTFFYIGKIKKAPGTFGSLAGILLWLFIVKIDFSLIDIIYPYQEGSDIILYLFVETILINIGWLIFLIFLTIFGSFLIKPYSKKVKAIDHKSVILDEVVGQITAIQLALLLLSIFKIDLLYSPKIELLFIASIFALFRFFDIKKPLLIGLVDRKIKNGFGVFLDDILAGIFAALMLFVFVGLGYILG